MSSFGDGDIKTRFQEEIDYICEEHYGKRIYDMSDEEKVRVVCALLDVIRYLCGEW